ncbi:hypothetical protein GCM10023185_21750 [Hymenobacter saemangeumensis]|uniref:Uncharacterized protein n=1 Tax=Hymenobacter saemangeumensis TaxID=1084522 RepID=A0ABP8IF53_9BACT
MKKIFSLLLMLLFMVASVDLAQARDNKPRKSQARDVKPKKKHFVHNSESSKGKNSRAQFRRRTEPPTIDFAPRKLEKFKTARANPDWKFAKGH